MDQKLVAHQMVQNGAMRPVKVQTSAQLVDTLNQGLDVLQCIMCVEGIQGSRNTRQSPGRTLPLSDRGPPRLLRGPLS